jgi:hypothetical protein
MLSHRLPGLGLDTTGYAPQYYSHEPNYHYQRRRGLNTAGYAPVYFSNQPHYQSQRRHGNFNRNTCADVVFNITFRDDHTDVRDPAMAPGKVEEFEGRGDVE